MGPSRGHSAGGTPNDRVMHGDVVTAGNARSARRVAVGPHDRDVAQDAGVSQDLVSLVERGRIEEVSVRALRGLARALGGELRIELMFRSAELDRLIDEGHAALVGAVARRLEALGWEIRPEVSYAVSGERGSIDLVAWPAASGTLLVIEVKTELVSIEATVRKHDEKVRLAALVVEERFGWRPRRVARLLALPEDSTPRRHVQRHAAVLDAAYPLRGSAVRRWLAAPSGSMAGLWFVAHTGDGRRMAHPVRRQRIRGPERRVCRPDPHHPTSSARLHRHRRAGRRCAPPSTSPRRAWGSPATAGTDCKRGS